MQTNITNCKSKMKLHCSSRTSRKKSQRQWIISVKLVCRFRIPGLQSRQEPWWCTSLSASSASRASALSSFLTLKTGIATPGDSLLPLSHGRNIFWSELARWRVWADAMTWSSGMRNNSCVMFCQKFPMFLGYFDNLSCRIQVMVTEHSADLTRWWGFPQAVPILRESSIFQTEWSRFLTSLDGLCISTLLVSRWHS